MELPTSDLGARPPLTTRPKTSVDHYPRNLDIPQPYQPNHPPLQAGHAKDGSYGL